VHVVGLVEDDQLPAAAPARQRPGLRGLAGHPLDDVRRTLIGGVEFDDLPVQVRGEGVGRGGLPDPRVAVQDDRLAVVLPGLGPLLQFVPGRVVAPHLRERPGAVLFCPVYHVPLVNATRPTVL